MESPNDIRIFRSLVRQALSNLSALVGIYDKEYRLLWHNMYFEETFKGALNGYPRTCLDHLHEESGCPEHLLKKTFESGSIQQGIFKISGEEIAERYFKTLTFPVSDSNSENSHVIEISWDIEETPAYESLLSGQNALLHNLANASLDAILTLDKDDRIIFWNKGAEKLFGFTIEEVMQQHFSVIVPERPDTEREIEMMRQLVHAQGYAKNFETELKAKDGRNIRVEITLAFLNPDRWEQSGSYLIIRDISARKNLEYIFRQSIDQLSKLHEIANLLHRCTSKEEIFRAMMISVTAGEGLRFNRAFLLMLNTETQMLEGTLAIGPADSEEARLIWQQMPQRFHSLQEIHESYRSGETDLTTKVMDIVRALSTSMNESSNLLIQAVKNRSSYLVHNGTTNVDFDSEICYIINNDTFAVIPIISRERVVGVLIVDNVFNREPITDKDIDALEIFVTQAGLALENILLQAKLSMRLGELEKAYSNLQDSQEKLVRAERLATIGEVVTKVSHEIRNPLVNIGGFSYRLRDKLPKDTEEYKCIDIIAFESRRLEKILDNILSYTAILEPKKELCNIQDLINQNLLVVMDDLQKNEIAIHLELMETDLVVNVDPNQMTQVFLNLLRNSMQAMPKGGKLTIITKLENGSLVITLKDTGTGIKKNDLDKLFQPFYTTRSRGLGLGLPISRQILENHGGRLTVESAYKKGASFNIFLPVS
ncbi:ATP-binding protein [candidate division KSB1 bacterium]